MRTSEPSLVRPYVADHLIMQHTQQIPQVEDWPSPRDLDRAERRAYTSFLQRVLERLRAL